MGLDDCCRDDQEIQYNFTDEYKIVTPAPKLLEVGDRCVFTDSFKKSQRELAKRDSINLDLSYLEEVCIVSKIYGAARDYNLTDKSNRTRVFPVWAVAPLPDKEEKKERKLMMTDTEREEFQKKNYLDDDNQDD